MFGVLGLLGAVLAGFMVDAMTSTSHDHEAGDPNPDEAEAAQTTTEDVGTGSMLDDPGDTVPVASDPQADPVAQLDPTAGLPTSHDGPHAADAGETLQGDDRNDILSGNGGNDSVSGAAGNDLLGGRGGDDLIGGGDGEDCLHGGDGRDTLVGDAGADDVHGEAGHDDLRGGDGGDSLSGDGGSDHLGAGKGNDSLIGGRGNDVARAGEGDDSVQGNDGNDRLAGGKGGDVVDGNNGNDTIWGGIMQGHDDRQLDFLNGGTGNDQINLGAGDYGNGGEGQDQFAISDIQTGDPVAQITDYNPHEDSLVVLYDAAHHPDPAVTVTTPNGSSDATVFLDGVAVAIVQGAAGLQPGDVTLKAA